jgi:hypothetical protein
MDEPTMTPFEQALVQSPLEEFRIFSQSRIEGLELTEEESSLESYRRAMELGLQALNETTKKSSEEEVS